MILVSILRFLGPPGTVVKPESTLDIALWVKSKMVAICSRSNFYFISFTTELKQIHDFDVHLRVFGRPTPDIVVRPEGTIDFGVQ